MNVGAYAKTLAAVVGTALTAAITHYPHSPWIPLASAAVTIIGVYAVPNVPKDGGKSPLLPVAAFPELASAIIATMENYANQREAIPTGGTPNVPLPPVPAPVGNANPATDPDPSPGQWAGTQNVANSIAAETAFRSFLDRVGATS